MKRRILGLMLFSALVSPQIAMASGCAIGNSNETAKSAGYILSSGTLTGATYGAASVAVAAVIFGTAAAAPIALPLFAGVTILTGVFPALRTVSKNAIDGMTAAF